MRDLDGKIRRFRPIALFVERICIVLIAWCTFFATAGAATDMALKDQVSPSPTIADEYVGDDRCTPDYCSQTVCFASSLGLATALQIGDRKLHQFSDGHDSTTRYGCAKITFPRRKPRGIFNYSEPVSSLTPLELSAKKTDILINSIDLLSKDNFDSILRRRVDIDRGNVIVFIHGYNTPFNYALARAAQLSFDMGRKGPILLFAWPGAIGANNILQGFSNIRRVERQLVNFMAHLATLPEVRDINVIAHSLGSRLVIDGLSDPPVDINTRPLFASLRQIVFAAPVVDVGALDHMSKSLVRSVRRITVLCSATDHPLELAKQSFSEKLVGLCEGISDLNLYSPESENPEYINEKVPMDVIDITNAVDCAGWSFFTCSHSRYAANPSVLQDLALIFASPNLNIHPMNRGGLYDWKTYNRRDEGLEFRS
jgi:esterase/lipase superfamily enzyme